MLIFLEYMRDSFKEKGQRQLLVETLIKKNIKDKRVLAAIGKIPRHLFMLKGLEHYAYVDKAYRIGAGQTISQPYTVAFQTELLELKKGDKVLEVGTGSGYQTAVLLELGAKVFTIERQRELYQSTSRFLPTLGYNPQFFFGDGYKGKATYGPFHKILVTAGAPFIPEDLIKQLKPGGIMVVPVGENNQVMKKLTKQQDDELLIEDCGEFAFVPLLSGIANGK